MKITPPKAPPKKPVPPKKPQLPTSIIVKSAPKKAELAAPAAVLESATEAPEELDWDEEITTSDDTSHESSEPQAAQKQVDPDEARLLSLPAPKISLKPLLHSEEDFKPIMADYEEKAKEMLSAGMDEAIVAVKCNITLSRVFEIRRGQPAHTVMNTGAPNKNVTQALAAGEMPSPKKVFASRMSDFNECLEIAISEYKSDPSSEINHHAMNGFMKTMKDLFESYQDLDDPQETAERLVKQVIYPYMSSMTKLVVDSFRDTLDDISPSLVSDFQKEQLKDGLKDGVRKIMEATRAEFNRAVKTLEVVYEARLDSLYMKPQPGSSNSSTSVLDDATTESQAA